MKSNSQLQLAPWFYLGDIDGDGSDEYLQVSDRSLSVYRSNFELTPVLEHVFPSSIRRLIIGDFTKNGREHGRDQICAILSDGTFQAFAISDDLKALWWWFTQPNFIGEDEHSIVGDFDGDGADDILVYKPSKGAIRLYIRMETGFFTEMPNFSLGNLAGFNLTNKQIFAGEFGQATGRKDILVVDSSSRQIIRFDSVTDDSGSNTFWWAFTTNANLFAPEDQVCVANLDGTQKDGVIIRNLNTGSYGLFSAEYSNGLLLPISNVKAGQLPVQPRAGKIIAAKVREASFRGEQGGERRDDILFFNEQTQQLIRTDARFNPSGSELTYWWAYNSTKLPVPGTLPIRTQIVVDEIRADWTTERGVFSDRDEIYFALTGGIGSSNTYRPIDGSRISPPPPEDYYQFWNETVINNIGLTEFSLSNGESALVTLVLREQDNDGLGAIVAAAIAAGAAIGAYFGAPTKELALEQAKKAGEKFYVSLGEDGDQNIGGFSVRVMYRQGRREVEWVSGPATDIIWQDGASALFKATDSDAQYILRVSVK
jgi:hypothetical protein